MVKFVELMATEKTAKQRKTKKLGMTISLTSDFDFDLKKFFVKSVTPKNKMKKAFLFQDK